MQCACYIAESNDGHPLRLNPCPEHERWAKAIRDVERERAAKIVAGEVVAERYRTWFYMNGVGNRSAECELTMHSDRLAEAIRNPNT